VLTTARCVLRPYRRDDVADLAAIANDFEVARWMTASFPHPYTVADATTWIAMTSVEDPVDNFVIEIDGALAGCVGLRPQYGESRGVAEFGYWLGRPYWGRGFATEAARAIVAHAFAARGLRRLEAHVFAPNIASAYVLEKCGFTREAILREAVVDRNEVVVDAWLYARLGRGFSLGAL